MNREDSEFVIEGENCFCEIHQMYYTDRKCLIPGKGYQSLGCPYCHSIGPKKDAEAKRKESRDNFIGSLKDMERVWGHPPVPVIYQRMTLSAYQPVSEEDWACLSIAKNYVDAVVHIQTTRSLLFYGDSGVGKTHLAVAILNSLLKQRVRGFYCTALEIIQRIRASWYSEEHYESTQLMQFLVSLPVLIVDGLGDSKVIQCQPRNRMILHTVIEMRMLNGKPTIFCTRLSSFGLTEILDESTVRLLLDYCTTVLVTKCDLNG